MVYHDPFTLAGWQPPFASNEKVVSICKSVGYTSLPLHLHEAIFAFVLYELVYRASSVISPKFCKAYNNLSKRTQINFDIHVVSMVQSLLILALSFPLFGDEVLAQSIHHYTPYSGFVSAMAAGYFAWDSYICLRYIKLFGPGFLVHGISALFVFSQSFRPYALNYAAIFLWFEASTPFLNVHWFASHLPAGIIPARLELLNGICLLVTFFSVRIVWGFYHAFGFAAHSLYYDQHKFQPIWVPLTMLVSNVTLDILNVYWFSKMVQLARKRLKSHKD